MHSLKLSPSAELMSANGLEHWVYHKRPVEDFGITWVAQTVLQEVIQEVPRDSAPSE